MPHKLAPPSVVINNGGTVRNADVICEQPDGNRLLALVNVFPIRDNEDEVVSEPSTFSVIIRARLFLAYSPSLQVVLNIKVGEGGSEAPPIAASSGLAS